MIHKITFLLHHKKNASNHLFSKQLKNLQSNLLIGGFISIIYSSFASGSSTGGAKQGVLLPGASALYLSLRPVTVGSGRAATIHTLSAHSYIIGSAKPPD